MKIFVLRIEEKYEGYLDVGIYSSEEKALKIGASIAQQRIRKFSVLAALKHELKTKKWTHVEIIKKHNISDGYVTITVEESSLDAYCPSYKKYKSY